MPSVVNEENSNETVNDESASDSDNLTNDEQSSVLSGYHGDNKSNMLNAIHERQKDIGIENSRSESSKEEINSATHSLHLETGKQTDNHENSSHLKSNAHITAVETTHSKEPTNHMELQTINTVGQKNGKHQSTEIARLDYGINVESVSSV